ncbi:hypothetical protein [Paracoccus alkenifer]|uniref:Uncharacterized protein n=1 Tax=Paracoccus alkenifer TaxID=65735 RepID=A0A1H6JNH8_9RHOB|nr:hypothetical protein [Paracoccus alkenifer]SEH60735.1 hypothetical protein SAMN04488075_0329 [Paracoccus alkenifer]
MSKIGLYVYQLVLSRTDNYQSIPFSNVGIGSELHGFLPQFIAGKQTARQNNIIERSWRLAPARDSGRAKQGIVHYGTYGFTSSIINPQNNQVLYGRGANDVEEIPLYYQFWVPDAGNYGFAVLQSFRERSCVTQVLGELQRDFNQSYDHVRVTHRKIMPTDDEVYQGYPVKKIMLSRKRVPRDRAEILRNLPADEANIELSFSVTRNGRFGMFRDVAPQIRAARGGAAMVFDGIEFNEASALISIGNTYRKVGIIGPSNTAGVIDITDDVQLGADMHPEFNSISAIATQIISDFRTQYGMS